VAANLLPRVIARLDVLHQAANLNQLNQPGFNLHAVRQFRPLRYSIWVSGAWRITFEWDNGAARVDLEQYH
jgi:toxin HigB-1